MASAQGRILVCMALADKVWVSDSNQLLVEDKQEEGLYAHAHQRFESSVELPPLG
jgi:hypothetical protein